MTGGKLLRNYKPSSAAVCKQSDIPSTKHGIFVCYYLLLQSFHYCAGTNQNQKGCTALAGISHVALRCWQVLSLLNLISPAAWPSVLISDWEFLIILAHHQLYSLLALTSVMFPASFIKEITKGAGFWNIPISIKIDIKNCYSLSLGSLFQLSLSFSLSLSLTLCLSIIHTITLNTQNYSRF